MTETPTLPAWRSIFVPRRLARRPRDQRGFIIPYSVDDGTDHPDFRMTQPARIRELLTGHLCWLCGEPYGDFRNYWLCFIGGPISMQNRMFTDGPMHEACAVYALRVCPFLASPTGRYTGPEDGPNVNPHMASERPEVFGLGFTRSFKTGVTPDGMLFMRPDSWRKILWYSHSGQLVRRQVFERTRSERRTPRYR